MICDTKFLPVLKLLKMATGMRSLLDTVVQALPQVSTFIQYILCYRACYLYCGTTSQRPYMARNDGVSGFILVMFWLSRLVIWVCYLCCCSSSTRHWELNFLANLVSIPFIFCYHALLFKSLGSVKRFYVF